MRNNGNHIPRQCVALHDAGAPLSFLSVGILPPPVNYLIIN